LGHKNAVNYVFGQGFASNPTKGVYSTTLDLSAALRGLTCKGKKHRGKRKGQKKRGNGQKGRTEG